MKRCMEVQEYVNIAQRKSIDGILYMTQNNNGVCNNNSQNIIYFIFIMDYLCTYIRMYKYLLWKLMAGDLQKGRLCSFRYSRFVFYKRQTYVRTTDIPSIGRLEDRDYRFFYLFKFLLSTIAHQQPFSTITECEQDDFTRHKTKTHIFDDAGTNKIKSNFNGSFHITRAYGIIIYHFKQKLF